jgi:hypothetical protein
MKTKLLLFATIISVILSACKGDKGDTGPAGSNGAQGPQGNANVTTVTVTTSNWILSGVAWYTTINVSSITQSIVDNGIVMVYMDAGGAWLALPVTIIPSSSYSSTYRYYHYLGAVEVDKEDTDLTTPANPGTKTFKIAVIAGSIARDNPNVNWDNYSEVKATFNLQD